MGQKTDKLQRLVEKMTTRYGQQDEDVRRLESLLEFRQATPPKLSERRRYGPSETKFLTPAKQIYYSATAENR